MQKSLRHQEIHNKNDFQGSYLPTLRQCLLYHSKGIYLEEQ